MPFGSLWAASRGFRAASADLGGSVGGLGEASFRLRLIFAVDTLHAVVVVFGVFLWGGFWHRFIVLSRRVDFRSQVLSSGFSWLFRLHLETQAFDLKQVVILHVVFRFGKKATIKKEANCDALFSATGFPRADPWVEGCCVFVFCGVAYRRGDR